MKNSISILFFVGVFIMTGAYANTSVNTISSNLIVSQTNDKISSLCEAAMKGDVSQVRSLIALGEELNEKSLGMTPAMFAARYNRVEVLRVLLLNGANLNIKSKNGYTAKEYAAMSNATDVLAIIDQDS